ncbi:MAG: adenylate/guanylate cyclase domain-containing protein [Gammaproteobacteria bacterium]|nr:adenylate/guanylate cyclase domain-containing protein [Gammaproteobacteria bacterium]
MPRLRRRLTAVIVSGVVTLLVVMLELNARTDAVVPQIGALARSLEAIAYDLRLRALTPAFPDLKQPVVIVDLDEASLERIGQFPWPRATTARLIERIMEAGAAVVALDMVFAEPEINPVARIVDVAPGTLSAPTLTELKDHAEQFSGDRRLARLVADAAATDVVFGSFLGGNERPRGVAPPGILTLSPEQAGSNSFYKFSSWTSVIADIAGHELADHVGIGHIITLPDALDGVIRRAPLLVQVGDVLVPSLALEAARRYLLIDQFEIEMTRQGALLSPAALVLDGSIRIPLDRHGGVLVPFRGPAKTFPYLSAADVLQGRLAAEQQASLADAVVLIGTSAIGLADLRSTPLDRVYPGVEVHATLVHALLEAATRSTRPAFPREPVLKLEMTALGLLATGLLLSLLMPLMGALLLTVMAAALGALWVAICTVAWTRYALDLPLTSPLLLLAGVTVTNLILGYLQESSRRRELRGMFDQYVPPAHIERMIERGASISLDGESRVMTVLFGDIKGFTALSEGRSAQELKQILNELFSPVTQTLLDHQGTIDKYVGDMIMAFWNAPLVDARHREHALDAALAFEPTLERINALLASRGLPLVDMGLGINTGLMNVGDMGSDFRRAYTVLGDAVNLGSRIESLTRHYGVRILVGEQTRDELEGYLFRFIDRVAVKGREQTVRLYEPICRTADATPELESRLLRYHGAYWMYAERDWDRAAAAFDRLLEAEPDCILYRIYRGRIDELRNQDLGPDWNGEFRHTQK